MDLYPLFILLYPVCSQCMMIITVSTVHVVVSMNADDDDAGWRMFEFISLICLTQLKAVRLAFLPNFGDNSGLAGGEFAEIIGD